MENNELIERLALVKSRIDEFSSLGKEDCDFLLIEAIKNHKSISFRGVVTGAAPKKSNGGVFELKLEIPLANISAIHQLISSFNTIVSVSIDPEDGQAKLADEKGIPFEDQNLFSEEGSDVEQEEDEYIDEESDISIADNSGFDDGDGSDGEPEDQDFSEPEGEESCDEEFDRGIEGDPEEETVYENLEDVEGYDPEAML